MDENEDSLQLTFDIAREALKTQQELKASLENKASMLLVFAGGILALLMNAWNTIINFPLIGQQIILGGVVIFALSVILSLTVAWVKKYRVDPNPYHLAKNYVNRPESETKLQLISNWSETWNVNKVVIEQNALVLRIAFGLQVVAFLMLGVAFGLSIFLR